MFINKLTLSNFRNFKHYKIVFSDHVTVIVGDNATGKTNILEAVYLLATGKSFKARLEPEMIAYGGQISRISGYILTSEKNSLEIILTNGGIQVGDNPGNIKKTQRKKLLLNGVSRRLLDFAGVLKMVLFGPWDMDLVTESPSIRRKFLDTVLFQVDREYRRSAMIYEKGLRQRNKLLFRIREEGISRSQLMYWDRLLIKHGQYITEKREDFIEYANNSKIKTIKPELYGDFLLDYDRSVISEGRLAQYEEEEVSAATTLVGPHRDDFIFKEKKEGNGRELGRYGSRGEQRMGVLWLKLAELSFVEFMTREKPVLLLDDIFSELDHEHRDVVMEVCGRQQTIITTADPHYVEGVKGKVINLE